MFDDFFETASELTRTGRPFATAVVVRAEKPTSGKPGDRAIVTLDGVMHGWIGGSCAQPTVIREALAALAEDRTRLVRLSPDGEETVALGGAGDAAGGAAGAGRSGERAGDPDGVVTMPMTCFSGGTLDIFIEPHHPRPRLLIVGTLPVARALAHLGKAMNYHVCMVDPAGEARTEAAAEPNADARSKADTEPKADAAPDTATVADELLGSLEELAARVTPLSFFVVATHGEYDAPALKAAFETDVPYIGLVASPKRGSSVRASLAAAGVAEADLARMKFPAGLDIGARRGDEIALSIMAEIIEVRRGLEELAWAEAEDAAGAGALTAIDPICGMEVKVEGALHTHRHEGRTWYFCCDGCRKRFAENPEEYTAA